MKRAIFLTLALGLLAAAGYGGYRYYTSRPAYSLAQIRKAWRTHDLKLFQKHVDVDGVVKGVVDAWLGVTLQGVEPESKAEAAGAALGAGLFMMLKPRLTENLTSGIENLVETGDAQMSAPSNADLPDSMNPSRMLDNPSGDVIQKRIKHVGPGKIDGQQAYVEVDVEIAEGKTETLVFRLRNLDGYWQVAELSNAKKLFDKYEQRRRLNAERERIKKEQARQRALAKLAKINDLVQERMRQAVKVETISKSKRDGEYRYQQKTIIDIQGKNLSGETITYITFLFTATNQRGDVLHRSRFYSNDPLEPGRFSWRWNVDVNRFKPETMELFRTPKSRLTLEAPLGKIEFADGEVLETYRSLNDVPPDLLAQVDE